MKILVTGGAGFIGSHVVEEFLAQGHEVGVLDNMSTGRIENLPPEVRPEVIDLRDPQLEKAMIHLDFEVICHHAAQISVPRSMQHAVIDAEINILGLINLLEVARRWGIARFIYISSGGAVYGDSDTLPVPETAPWKPLSPYAAAKAAGEIYLEYYRQVYAMDYVILRYANVFGPRQIPLSEAGVNAIFMRNLWQNASPVIYCPPGMAEGCRRDYVYVKDCARACVLALTCPPNQAYNIGSGNGVSTYALWQSLVKVSGRRPPAAQFAGPRPGDVRQIYLDRQKAEQKMGWRPQYTLEQGLAATWQWFVGQEQ
jgi:UDP-glucose 4-epimerase